MNYVEGGLCHATRQRCLLGTTSLTMAECALRGAFDVWIMQNDDILLSDIGPPSPEPKRSVALGVRRPLAGRLALEAARTMGTRIITTQVRCRRCGGYYWISDHDDSMNASSAGRRYFCSHCIGVVYEMSGSMVGEYWCG
jgi:hypothetical protein